VTMWETSVRALEILRYREPFAECLLISREVHWTCSSGVVVVVGVAIVVKER